MPNTKIPRIVKFFPPITSSVSAALFQTNKITALTTDTPALISILFCFSMPFFKRPAAGISSANITAAHKNRPAIGATFCMVIVSTSDNENPL